MSYLTSYFTVLAVVLMVVSPIIVPATISVIQAGKRLLGIAEPRRTSLHSTIVAAAA
jgi:hypothetical protein